MSGTGPPLAGLRITAVEQYGAAPFGTMVLADLGAEVIKVEDARVGGDVRRSIPPGISGSDSLFFESFNRGKRSIRLDLSNPHGREVLERLVASSDALLSNVRADLTATLGLRHADLAHVNPRIVCVSLSAYGSAPEDARLPGYDAVIQAEAGWAALTGDPDGPPTKSGLSLVDYAAGLTAALGLLAGVLDARRTGVGRDLDTNLYDTALALLTYPATWWLSAGHSVPRRRLSAHPSVVPFQFFPTADGHIAVACAKEKFFRILVDAIGLPELATDARFSSFAARDENRDELLRALEDRFRTRTSAEWVALLRGDVPISAVRELEEVLEPEGLAHRGMLAAYDHPTLGPVRSVGSPLHVGGHVPDYRPGPGLGADHEALLAEIGLYAPDVARLSAAGAFGPPDEATEAATTGA